MRQRFACLVIWSVLCFGATSSFAEIADTPVFLVSGAEPNVLFNMSVETPMGGAAYNDQPDADGCGGRITRDSNTVGGCYSTSKTYLGYFDPQKCYSYDASDEYFYPDGAATSTFGCTGKFSGNMMNWATMTAMDAFTLTMTGGDRKIDTTSLTVVQRNRKQNNDNWFPPKYLSSGDNVAPSSVTPWGDSAIHIYNTDTGSGTGFIPQVQFGTSYKGDEKGTYRLRVKVCDASAGLESNCTGYGGNTYYKPEGLVQENASSMRFAVTSYTKDSDETRDGGVLRSNMKYVGPTAPDGSGSFVTNPNKEFGSDGIYINDPESLAGSGGVYHSGVIQYLNKFSHYGYKGKDPISELFYETLRFYKNLGPTPEYSSGLTDDQKGGFPVLTTWADPFQNNCQKSFIIGINDANPWLDKSLPGTEFTAATYNGVTLRSADYGEPSTVPTGTNAIDVSEWTDKVGADQGIHGTDRCIGCTESVCDWSATDKTITALSKVAGTCPYPAKENSYYISGLAYYANVSDIRPDLGDADTSDADNDPQTVTTFMIDTQEYSASPLTGEMNMLWLAGKYGGFVDSNGNDRPDLASEWDANSDGEPDNYVLATKPQKLVTALRDAFLNVKEQNSSVAALAANSTRLNTVNPSNETIVYQASFNTADWTGSLQAIRVNTDVTLGTVKWSTDQTGKIPAHGSRNIFTWDGSDGQAFTEANWDNLSAAMKTALIDTTTVAIGKQRLNYLRGDTSNEQQNGGIFRNRPLQSGTGLASSKLLGDIINSSPAYVVALDFEYDQLPTSAPGVTSYNNFVSANSSRTPMLYIGANDGMLHGFNADTGAESFAYVPNSIASSLPGLSFPNYSHKYTVDGTPFVGDAYIDNPWDTSSGAAWRTILVASTGAGSRTVFALDISDPDNFDASDVMWEFSDADLGYCLGTPTIARMKNGAWVAIFGNGYNSDNKRAVLFVVDLASGALIRKIDTGTGSAMAPNGLATPAFLVDGERTITTAYAGDLLGNLWKFDLDSTTVANWDSEFSASGNPAPLFQARNSAGQIQPITATPNIATNPHGGYMVHFGTGKFFETEDKLVGNSPSIQSHYAIYDDGSRISTTDRSELVQQSFTHELTHSSGPRIRISSTRPSSDFDWTATTNKTRGWCLDMTLPTSGAQGERVIQQCLLRHGRVVINSMTPVSDPCSYGGTGALTEVDALTGNRLSYSSLDVDDDGVIDDDDLGELPDTTTEVVSTREYDSILSAVFVLTTTENSKKEYKMGTKTDNTILIQAEKGGDSLQKGRRSWRQLR